MTGWTGWTQLDSVPYIPVCEHKSEPQITGKCPYGGNLCVCCARCRFGCQTATGDQPHYFGWKPKG